MILSYIVILAYLISATILARYFTKDSTQHQHQKTTMLLISFAIVAQALGFSDFWNNSGIVFGLANSATFVAWLIATLLFLASISKPVHVLGIIVYPLTATVLLLGLIFPDTNTKVIPMSLASHVLLSIAAYALLALATCQSVLLNIQQKHLHNHKINSFINKLPPLQTMEKLLLQSLKIGFYLLTLALITGFVFIDDFFAQHLIHKTVLSLIAWLVFAVLILGAILFGWRGKQTIIAIQVGFGFLVVAYFGSKFVLERLIN